MQDMPTSSGKAQASLPQSQTPPPQDQALPTVHVKAHRKTNRRKISDSSTSPLWEGWQKREQETLFTPDSPEPVARTMEEVQLPQSSWILWLCWFCSMTSWFHFLLLLMILR